MTPDPCSTCDIHPLGRCQFEETRQGGEFCFWWIPLRTKPEEPMCKSKDFYLRAEAKGLIAQAEDAMTKALNAIDQMDDKPETASELISESSATLSMVEL